MSALIQEELRRLTREQIRTHAPRRRVFGHLMFLDRVTSLAEEEIFDFIPRFTRSTPMQPRKRPRPSFPCKILKRSFVRMLPEEI
jgi:hypothetical protein